MNARYQHDPVHRSEAHVRVDFDVEPDEGGGFETMWCAPRIDGTFEVDNVPLHVFGLARKDAVSAERDPRGRLRFTRVVARGGHSTYRLLVREGADSRDFRAAWAPLAAHGCGYERASPTFLAVDVPTTADIHEVYALLEQGMADGVWLFDELHCGHPLYG